MVGWLRTMDPCTVDSGSTTCRPSETPVDVILSHLLPRHPKLRHQAPPRLQDILLSTAVRGHAPCRNEHALQNDDVARGLPKEERLCGFKRRLRARWMRGFCGSAALGRTE